VGSFWWKDILRVQVLFRGIARCVLGNGAIITFWEDLWCDEVLSHKYPQLFYFARNEAISVQQFIQAHDLDTLFALPISPEAFVELLQLQDLLNQVEVTPSEDDSWQFIWGDQRYSSRHYYQMVFANFNSSLAFTLL
jgi:hypothetical protein